ncbi:MAG: OmpA family protein [candidate division WOR-3 bacterium]
MRFLVFLLILVIIFLSFSFFYYYNQKFKPAVDRYDEIVKENKTLTEYLNKLREENIKKDSIILAVNGNTKVENKTSEQKETETRIPILSDDLFNPGGFELTKNGRGLLKKFSEVLLKDGDVEIIVEGHTDNDKIGTKMKNLIPTNWELSAFRAINVLKFLRDSLNVKDEKLSAVAYGSSRPVADNSTTEGKKQNRRIELVIKKSIDIEETQ